MGTNRKDSKPSGELTIVTGFFDFGRGNHKQQRRSSRNYLDYFRGWARLQNNVIIYTTKEFESPIKEIRKEFGREDRTTVNVVDDIRSIEPKMLAAMEEIEKRGIFQKWRVRDYDLSNVAMYNYIVMLKFWMLQDAAEKNPQTNMFAWLDFGWNHGGERFPIEEEFDFLWEYEFDKDKVHLFARKHPDQEIGFIKLQMMRDGIMSGQFMCSPANCKPLYEYIKEAMWALLAIDTMDDDQMLLTMAYKRHPEMFQIYESDWFLPVKEYGGNHLTEVENFGKEKRHTLANIKKRGIYKTIILFYIQCIRRSTEERYYLEKRIDALFKEYS